MAIEKKWSSVSPQLFTSDGNTSGVVKIANTAGFKVKQEIVISANTIPDLKLQVKRVTKTQIIVGPFPTVQGKNNINSRADISAYTVALGAYIYATEQDKATLKPDDIIQAVYDQEPAVAIRTLPVDQFGDYYNSDNPIPITGNITVSSTPLHYDDVKLTRDSDGDITLVRKYIGGVLKLTQALIYDSNKNVIEIKDI